MRDIIIITGKVIVNFIILLIVFAVYKEAISNENRNNLKLFECLIYIILQGAILFLGIFLHFKYIEQFETIVEGVFLFFIGTVMASAVLQSLFFGLIVLFKHFFNFLSEGGNPIKVIIDHYTSFIDFPNKKVWLEKEKAKAEKKCNKLETALRRIESADNKVIEVAKNISLGG